MVDQKRYGGKQLDLEGAASFVEGLTFKQVEQVKADAAQAAIEQLSPKEQAALEATGSSGRREPEATLDYEDVRQATRRGGNESIVATMAQLNPLKNQAKTYREIRLPQVYISHQQHRNSLIQSVLQQI